MTHGNETPTPRTHRRRRLGNGGSWGPPDAAIVPVRPVPNQMLTVQLSDQPTQLAIYQKSTGLFMDVYVNGSLIIGGVLCLNGEAIVRTAYLGFIGDFAFCDTQPSTHHGPADPDYTGLGARWPLYYFLPSELTDPLAQ